MKRWNYSENDHFFEKLKLSGYVTIFIRIDTSILSRPNPISFAVLISIE